ncbi:MAG: hypothetical protein ACW99H_10770, partial [Candidatus Thorarchaeota archaeon]
KPHHEAAEHQEQSNLPMLQTKLPRAFLVHCALSMLVAHYSRGLQRMWCPGRDLNPGQLGLFGFLKVA